VGSVNKILCKPAATLAMPDTRQWINEFQRWQQRSLADKHYVYLWADGIEFNHQHPVSILLLIGLTPDGRQELLGLETGNRASAPSWTRLLLQLQHQGLKRAPALAIGDSRLGLWQALAQRFPTTRAQYCWMYETARVLSGLPNPQQPDAQAMLQRVYSVATRTQANATLEQFIQTYQNAHPSAVEHLSSNREALLTFYDFPTQHRSSLFTLQPIAGPCSQVRSIAHKIRGHASPDALLILAFKLLQRTDKQYLSINPDGSDIGKLEHNKIPVSAVSDMTEASPERISGYQPRYLPGLGWLVSSGLIALLAVGGWWGYQRYQNQPQAPVSVSVMPVQQDTLEVTVTESGIVELGGQQTFKAPSDVTVEAVLVKERQRVKAGDVLLILRDRGLQRELDTQLVTHQMDQNTLQRQQAIVEEKQQELQEAKAQYQDFQTLFNEGVISENALRGEKDRYDTALYAVRDAQVELENAKLKIQNNQVIINNLRAQLADNKITAPFDAEILKVEVKPGDGVQQEGRLLTIGDPQQETIRLQLSSLNATKVSVNMPVRVSVIGPNPEVYPGRIARISPQALQERNENNAATGQAKVEAEAILDQPSGELIPGSAVSVEIVLNQRRDVAAIPLNALHSEGNSDYVWVRDATGKAQKRLVTGGLQTLESVEILSGLEVGDQVVVSFPADQPLAPGMAISTPADPAP
jgi:HlyD family secretion protein